MAISTDQKVDLLYKQAFGVAKTDTAGNKSPSNEPYPSLPILRGDIVWSDSALIPQPTPPATDTATVDRRTVECAADTTVNTSATGGISPTWLSGFKDWIPPEFGPNYAVKVYVNDPGVADPTTGGTLLAPDGEGGRGEFWFNYSAGILHFIGNTPIPTALTAGKRIYLVGYRYVGAKGVGSGGGGGGGGTAIEVDITATGNIAGPTVQDAIVQLDTSKVAKAGDTMTGRLTLSADPTLALHAATKQYADDLLAGPVVSAADQGKAPKLAADGKLHISTAPDGLVLSVNGVDPDTDGNVAVNIVGVQTGIALPAGAPTPIGGVTDGVVFIISGSGTAADGSAYIWSDGASDWLEISPPGLASTDARYLKLIGGTMLGDITMDTNTAVYLSQDPVAGNEAATKDYADTKLPLAGGTLTGPLILDAAPTVDLGAATRKFVIDTVAAGSGGGGGGPTTGDLVDITATGTIPDTTAQGAITQLEANKVAKAGDTMTGRLELSADPTIALHAVTKQYADGLLAGPVVSAADEGKAPKLAADGKLHISAAPDGLVLSVNGVDPDTDGNVAVNIVGVQTGIALPAGAPTPIGGVTDGVVFIISGSGTAADGSAYIWSDGAADWLEISPPGLASTDARYLKLIGGTMLGDITMDTNTAVYLSQDPVADLEAATKQYADTKLPLSGGTLTGSLILNAAPTVDLGAATRKFVLDSIDAAGGGGGGGPTTGDLVDITATGTIPNTTAQGAIAQLETSKVAKAGDTMTGRLELSADPTLALHATTKQYTDAKFAPSPATTAADDGLAPILNSLGKLNESTTPSNVPLTVNGVGVTAGTQNIAVNIVGVQTGTALPAGAPTPIGGVTDGVMFIISGSGTPADGSAYIWSDGAADWLEISPPGLASTDARYLKLIGGTMLGDITMGTGHSIYLNSDPTADLEAATKAYVDANANGNAAVIEFNPTGNTGGITATTVEDAIVELGNSKVNRTGDTMTGMLSLRNAGVPLLPSQPEHVATKDYVDGQIADLAISAGAGGVASAVTFTPGGNITTSNVQAAITELDTKTVKIAGSTMTGVLTLSGAPTSDLHASTKKYVDDQFASTPATTAADNGKAPVLDAAGKLNVTTMPATVPLTVNGVGVTPGSTNIAVNIVGVDTGATLPAAPTPIQGVTDGVMFIISGSGTDADGSAFIWSDTANSGNGAWLEISPPGIASTDARYLKLSGGTLTGPLILDADPLLTLEAATKSYVDTEIAAAVLAGSGGGTASEIDVVATGTIPNTNVQGAITQLEANKVAKAGDTMTGRLELSADPTLPLHAATAQWVDAKFAPSALTTALDDGKAPILNSQGKLNISTTPVGVVLSVNGVDPDAAGNVAINIVGVQTGISLPASPTPIGGVTDGVVFIISDSGTAADGSAYIWSDNGAGPGVGAWLEISPPGLASTDARYLKLIGGTLSGDLTMDSGASVYLASDPTAPLEAATKAYVDANSGGGNSAEIEFNPTGNTGGITATTVEDALVQLGNSKVNRTGDTMTGMLSLLNGGTVLVPTQPEHVVTKKHLDNEIAQAVIDAGAGGIATAITFNPTGNISSTNVQDAIVELDTSAVKRSGDSMTGYLILNDDPSIDEHASTKRYVDDQFSGPVVSATDAGTAPVLASNGKLDLSAMPGGLVTSVNGVLPTAGNVAISLVGTETGPALPTRPTPINGVTDGVVFIISGAADATQDGTAYIFSNPTNGGATGVWLEVSPPGQASSDARYLRLVGGTISGPLYLPAVDPVDDDEAVRKSYVDAKVTGGTADTTIFTPGNGTGLTGGTVEDALNQLGRDKVNRAGDTMTGALILSASPTGSSPDLQAATKGFVADQLTGPVVGGADDAGKAPKLDGDGRLDISAMPSGLVTSVNGVGPTNGNVAVNIVGVQTGTSLPAGAPTPIQGVTDGVMFIISGSGTLADGSAYIWSDNGSGPGVGAWLEISPPGLASTDARYLKLTGGTLSAPLYLNANPVDPTEASNKAYVDAQIAAVVGGNTPSTNIEVTPTTTITATNLQDAIQQLDDKKVAKAGDTMTGSLILNGDPSLALEAAPKQYVDGKFAGPVVSATAAGKAPVLDSNGKLDGSAIGGVVKSVNGIGPEPDGSVVVSLTATQTGPLPLPAAPTPVNGKTDGIVFVVSNNVADPDKNGQAYIWSDSVNAWLEISPPGTAEADARYVNLSGDTMQGPFYLKADPVAGKEAATKDYVDSKAANAGGVADNITFQPGGGITSTTVQDAIVFLGTNKVSKGGDTMTGHLDLENPFNNPLAPTQPQHATNKQYVDGKFAGPIVSNANDGRAPVLASNGKLDKSAMAPETVLSVNGITPDPSTGNVPVSFGATQTGTLNNRPNTAADSTVYIVSGDPNAALDGTAYIYSTFTNAWLEISPPGQASSDARYVQQSGDTMTGILYLRPDAPVDDREAANKKYVDDRVSTGPSALPANNVVITNPGNGVTGTNLDSAIFQLASGKVAKAGDSMSGSLTMTNGSTITGLPQPNSGTDAAHKAYVDGHRFALDGLTDVTAPSPADNDVLKWDNGTSRWVSGAAPGGSAGSSTITPAGNITTTNVQSAIYELDTKKVSKAGDTMTGDLGMSNGATITGLPNTPSSFNDAANKGYVDNLVANRSYTLDNLTDVSAPSPGDGNVLRWNGPNGRWENSSTGPGSAADNVTITPSGNITSTNVQSAIYELDNEKVRKSGDTMNSGSNLTFQGNGTVKGIPQPVDDNDASNKFYVDGRFAGPPTSGADVGKAPVLDGDGRLNVSTLPNGAVTSVNGVTPTNGNVPVSFVGTQTGDALPGNNANTPTAILTVAPTPMGGSTDGVVFIISGNTTGVLPDPNGQAFIWSSGSGRWLEISPPGEASADARYVNIVGDTMSGDLTMGNGKTVYLGRDPASDPEAATKRYVDDKVASGGVTGDLFTLGSTTVTAGSTQNDLAGLNSVTSGAFTGTLYGPAQSLLNPRRFEILGDDVSATTQQFDGQNDLALTAVLKNVGTPVNNLFRKITTDDKGRVSSTDAVVSGDITAALGYNPVNRANDTMDSGASLVFQGGGSVKGLAYPDNSDWAAPRSYVDGAITNFGNGLSLNSLNNVTANPGNGDVLQWSSLSNQWVAGTVTASGSITIGGTTINLNGATDRIENLTFLGIGSNADANYGLNMPNKNALISQVYTGGIGVGRTGIDGGFVIDSEGGIKVRNSAGGDAAGMVFQTAAAGRLWYLGNDGAMRLASCDGSFADQGTLMTLNSSGTLDVAGNLQGSGILAKNGIDFVAYGGAGIYAQSAGGGPGNNQLVFRAGTPGAERFTTFGPDGTLSVGGQIYASGNISAFSDERVKADWNHFAADFVSKLANVKSGIYTRKDTGERQVGVSAQSLREVIPEAVMEDSEGKLSVVYGHAALASSVELAKKVVALEAQIDELKALVAKLMER